MFYPKIYTKRAIYSPESQGNNGYNLLTVFISTIKRLYICQTTSSAQETGPKVTPVSGPIPVIGLLITLVANYLPIDAEQ